MSTDDTIRDSKQAREDALLAMIEAGLFPGTLHVGLESEDDITALYECVTAENPSLVIYRVPLALVKHGAVGGLTSAATILGMPEAARGKVMLAFDGWSDDPRELFEIPIVVEFCQALLMVSAQLPQFPHAKKILVMMVNEHDHAFVSGNMLHPQWLEVSGGIWLCGMVFKDRVYYRSRQSASGWLRQYTTSFEIWRWLTGAGPPPRMKA